MTFTFLGKKYTFDFSLQGDRAILVSCMSIALVFWFFTKMSNEYTADRVVGVKFVLPDGQAFSELPADEITVTISGKGWDLMNDYFFGGQSDITVDLETETTDFIDQSSLLGRISNRSMEKRDLEILKTSPSYFSLKYEEEILKKIPIVLRLDVDLAAGHYPTSEWQISPDSIEIKGAKIILDTIKSWETQIFALKEMHNAVELNIPLKIQLENQVKLSTKEVKASILVEKWTEKQLYSDVKILNGPDSLKLFPPRTEITFSCPLSQFNEITANDFETVVDLKNVPMNEKKNTVSVLTTKSPNFVRGIKIFPKSVQFFFMTKNIKKEEN